MSGEYVPEIEITPAMVKAGLDELRERQGDSDLAYLVGAIYMAMEYERLDSLGQLRGFFDKNRQISNREIGNG